MTLSTMHEWPVVIAGIGYCNPFLPERIGLRAARPGR